MPPYGADGSFTYPNGVRITLLNRYVLGVRPIGYKLSPQSRLGCLASSAVHALGVPAQGLYFVYIGSNTRRKGDIVPSRNELFLGQTARIVPSARHMQKDRS